MTFIEKTGIERETAVKLLNQYITNENMLKHCLASEAVMRKLAGFFGEDGDIWAMAGLLHDLDAEMTAGDMQRHTIPAREILLKAGVKSDIVDAICMHNEEASGKERVDRFHIALAAGETITGLIMATTLVYPDKKIASVKTKSIVKRMKEKAFAASVNRDTIRECEKLGLALDQFASLALEAMTEIAGELEL